VRPKAAARRWQLPGQGAGRAHGTRAQPLAPHRCPPRHLCAQLNNNDAPLCARLTTPPPRRGRQATLIFALSAIPADRAPAALANVLRLLRPGARPARPDTPRPGPQAGSS
jgi:hypothetical protein